MSTVNKNRLKTFKRIRKKTFISRLRAFLVLRIYRMIIIVADGMNSPS